MKKLFFGYIILFTCLFLLSCQEKKAIMNPIFEGKDLAEEAQILRDKKNKKAILKIESRGAWQLYAGYSVDSIDFSKPLLIGEGAGSFSLDVADSLRSYFQLVTEDGKAILSERLLPMEGGYNFRDLGGLKTKDGRYVKWGKLFRSDDLVNLTDDDVHYLNYIPLRSIVDFRAEPEIKQAPDRLPYSVHNNYILNIITGNLSMERVKDSVATENMISLMMEMNELLVTDSACISRYREFFQVLQDAENIPIMYHCSAGKDRTGMATALILYALGVDEDTIMDDYMLSKEYLADKYAPVIARYPQTEHLFTVSPEYLTAGIAKMKEQYGSVENYLVKELNVDIDKLKELYLY